MCPIQNVRKSGDQSKCLYLISCVQVVVNWQFEKSFHFLYDHLMCSRREREEHKTFNYQLDKCPARKKKEIKWKMDFGSWKIMLFCCVMNIFLSPMKHVNGSNLKVFFLLSLTHFSLYSLYPLSLLPFLQEEFCSQMIKIYQ